jgi:segregation and condensation protein A
MLVQENLDYTVQLPEFEGPLDLLLRLIEREELDITTIALAKVADTYLAHVRALEMPDPAALSAFLVIAARLLLIKSRALLPRPVVAKGNEEVVDEAEELAQQLREYQRYKQAALILRQREEQGQHSYMRAVAPPMPTIVPQNHTIQLSVGDLIAAVQRRVQLLLPLEPPPTPLPAPKIITVPEMASRIEQRLAHREWFSFEDLLSFDVQRVEIVVALWATLELLKRRAIVVEQETLFGPIMIGRGPNLGSADFYNLLLDVGPSNASEG